MDQSFTPLILATTALSLTASFYGLATLMRSKKKLGAKVMLASIACQILFWDFLRCLTIGIVSGIWNLSYPDTGVLCTIIGPLTDMSHRVSFFLVLGHVIMGLKKSEESAALRWTGAGTVIIGYLISIGFAVLPYLRGTTYLMGQEGFCTYYADQIFYLDYETMTNDQIFKSTLGYNIVLSVLPFALMFVMVAVGIITGFCAKSQDSTSLVNAGALLFCYTPMMGVGMALTANYFGVSTIFTSWDPEDMPNQMLILFLSMVLMPVSTPLVKLLANATISCYKSRTEQQDTFCQKTSSNSTTILVNDVDCMVE